MNRSNFCSHTIDGITGRYPNYAELELRTMAHYMTSNKEHEMYRYELEERDRRIKALEKRIEDSCPPPPEPKVTEEKVTEIHIARKWHGFTLSFNKRTKYDNGNNKDIKREACFHTKAALIKFIEGEL